MSSLSWIIICIGFFGIMASLGCASPSSSADTTEQTLPPSAEKAARASNPPAPTADGSYGEKVETGKARPISKGMPRIQDLKNQKQAQESVVKAKVLAVCPKKGCWMQVEGKEGPLRVTFKDYGFFVPTELIGREVALKGEFTTHTESVAEQKHLLEDARKSKAEINAVTKDKEALRFVATGVQDLSVTTPAKTTP